jgi:hypothetical protein
MSYAMMIVIFMILVSIGSMSGKETPVVTNTVDDQTGDPIKIETTSEKTTATNENTGVSVTVKDTDTCIEQCEMIMNSANTGNYLKLQDDGNLVLKDKKQKIIWASGSHIRAKNMQKPFRLIMQSDGNLVIYDKNNKVPWSSRSYIKAKNMQKPFKLVVQDDGNLVIYDKNNKVPWATMTNNK